MKIFILRIAAFSLINFVMDWMFVSHQNSYVEALSSNMIEFEDGVFGKSLPWGWSPHDVICALIRRGKNQSLLSLPYVGTQERRWPSTRQENASHQELDRAGTLILDFPACRTVKNKCLLLKPPNLWYFVIANWADQDNSYGFSWMNSILL